MSFYIQVRKGNRNTEPLQDGDKETATQQLTKKAEKASAAGKLWLRERPKHFQHIVLACLCLLQTNKWDLLHFDSLVTASKNNIDMYIT